MASLWRSISHPVISNTGCEELSTITLTVQQITPDLQLCQDAQLTGEQSLRELSLHMYSSSYESVVEDCIGTDKVIGTCWKSTVRLSETKASVMTETVGACWVLPAF